ncbi:type II toxin-antitoxin system CcdA family antitoxin [Aurantimonas endophytica]|uniref:Post-segregation antitoxin (Ccd killing protein) n=1 Tax=Aurantimonas endophytica TaxID=1522175 RepID=A0A7W6HED2_9HYPH|nr:post-segregation antitoxin (ccd killing protein) [Aurantimonas endophytica]
MKDIVIDPALLAEAEALKVDRSGAATEGVAQAVRAARRSQWLDDNIATLAASNDYVERPASRSRATAGNVALMHSLMDKGRISIGKRSANAFCAEPWRALLSLLSSRLRGRRYHRNRRGRGIRLCGVERQG